MMKKTEIQPQSHQKLYHRKTAEKRQEVMMAIDQTMPEAEER
jgi:hypothetical protein